MGYIWSSRLECMLISTYSAALQPLTGKFYSHFTNKVRSHIMQRDDVLISIQVDFPLLFCLIRAGFFALRRLDLI